MSILKRSESTELRCCEMTVAKRPVSPTVAHICKHNNIFLKHNKQFSEHNTIFSKYYTKFMKHNTIFSKHNAKFAKHTTIFAKHNTKFSKSMQIVCYYTTYKPIITQPLTLYAPCKSCHFVFSAFLHVCSENGCVSKVLVFLRRA